MKLFITYILVFLVACLSAQSVEDKLALNKIDFSNDKMAFAISIDTTSTPYNIKTIFPNRPITDQIVIVRKNAELSLGINPLNSYSYDEFHTSFNRVSGACLQESDRRSKKDVRALKEHTLQKILQLEPVSYLMKNQRNRGRSIGLMAQDVKKVYPSLVQNIDGEDALAISYAELIPILIKGIQEQQETIKNLKNNQYVMQKELAIFKSQIEQLTKNLIGEHITFRNQAAVVAQNQN